MITDVEKVKCPFCESQMEITYSQDDSRYGVYCKRKDQCLGDEAEYYRFCIVSTDENKLNPPYRIFYNLDKHIWMNYTFGDPTIIVEDMFRETPSIEIKNTLFKSTSLPQIIKDCKKFRKKISEYKSILMTENEFMELVDNRCIICKSKLKLDKERQEYICSKKASNYLQDHLFVAILNHGGEITHVFINPEYNLMTTVRLDEKTIEYFSPQCFKIDIDPIGILKLRGNKLEQKLQLIINFS
jgi:hypothetical protein